MVKINPGEEVGAMITLSEKHFIPLPQPSDAHKLVFQGLDEGYCIGYQDNPLTPLVIIIIIQIIGEKIQRACGSNGAITATTPIPYLYTQKIGRASCV